MHRRTGGSSSGGAIKSEPWEIVRLTSKDKDTVAAVLPGLYEIDTEAFKKKDQYGLKLLQLALCQPEAFWIAKTDVQYLGYVSIFILKTNRLFDELTRLAKKGELDLPELLDYSDVLAEEPLDYGTTPAHLYIDAIAIKKPKSSKLTEKQRELLRRDLISKARADLSGLKIASICSIAIRTGIATVLGDSTMPFKYAGRREKSVTKDDLFRELYACDYDCNSAFKTIMDGISRISHLEIFLRRKDYPGETTGGVGIDFRQR